MKKSKLTGKVKGKVGARNQAVNITRKYKYGVEIEVSDLNISITEFCNLLEAKGIKTKDTTHRYATHTTYSNIWKVEKDGSLTNTGSNTPCEIVSPISTNFEQLKIVCETLKEVGASVKAECGVHVHHDAKDLDLKAIKNVYKIYHKHEDGIKTFLPMSRRDDTHRFCKSLDSRMDYVDRAESINELSRLIGQVGNEPYNPKRYYRINFCAYKRYGTLEFRQHSGTIDYEKIMNWIRFTHRIMEIAKLKAEKNLKIRPKTEKWLARESEKDFWKAKSIYMELDIEGTDLAEYVKGRRKNFKNENQ